MGLSFSSLAEGIHCEFIRSATSHTEMETIALADRSGTSFGAHTLLLGESCAIFSLLCADESPCAGAVGVGYCQELLDLCIQRDISLAFLREKTDLLAAVLPLSNALLRHQQLCLELQRLGCSKDLTQLLCAAGELTGSSICIVDEAFHLLCSFPSTKEAANTKWWPLQKLGAVHHHSISRGNTVDGRHTAEIEGETYTVCRIPSPRDRYYAIFAPTSSHEAASSSDISRCVDALALFLSRNHLSTASGASIYERMFIGALEGTYISPQTAAAALHEVGFAEDHAYYYGVIVPADDSNLASFNYRGLRLDLLNCLSTAQILFHQDALHLLADITKADDLSMNRLSDLITPVLLRYGAVAGISNRFKGFSFFSAVREQPDNALAIGRIINPSYCVHPFSYYALYKMVELCSSHMDIRQLIHPMVQYLRQYDQENGSEYVSTLQAYFNSDRKIQKAADHLYIHKNTFLYRMEKIKALTNMDFTNEYRTIHLQISCSICKWIDRTK